MATHTRRSGYGVAFFRSGNPKRQRGMAEATILPRVLPLPSSRFAFYPTENVTNPITRWRSGIPEKDVKAGDLCQIGGGVACVAWRGVVILSHLLNAKSMRPRIAKLKHRRRTR